MFHGQTMCVRFRVAIFSPIRRNGKNGTAPYLVSRRKSGCLMRVRRFLLENEILTERKKWIREAWCHFAAVVLKSGPRGERLLTWWVGKKGEKDPSSSQWDISSTTFWSEEGKERLSMPCQLWALEWLLHYGSKGPLNYVGGRIRISCKHCHNKHWLKTTRNNIKYARPTFYSPIEFPPVQPSGIIVIYWRTPFCLHHEHHTSALHHVTEPPLKVGGVKAFANIATIYHWSPSSLKMTVGIVFSQFGITFYA